MRVVAVYATTPMSDDWNLMRTRHALRRIAGIHGPMTAQKTHRLHLLVEDAIRGGQSEGTVDQLVLEQCERSRQPGHA